MRYRFWSWVHRRAEDFWHWVYFKKVVPLQPKEKAQEPIYFTMGSSVPGTLYWSKSPGVQRLTDEERPL